MSRPLSFANEALAASRRHSAHPVLLMVLACVALSAADSSPVSAQGAPGTDIWVIDLMESGGDIQVGEAVRVTDRAGYDNQPHFGPRGESLLYTSIDEAGQADIYRYSFSDGNGGRLTRTAPESEYSATLMPSGDRVSVIRVEADSSQRLWSFDLSGSDPQVVLHSVMPVGYHAWIDANTLVLFVLGSPATLQIADIRSQTASTAAENIGRSLHKIPQQRLASFLHWETGEGSRRGVIKTIDPFSGELETIGPALDGSEDYAWTAGGVILSGTESKLYRLTPGDSGGWQEVADLATSGIQGITRLAISPDGRRLAVVGNR